MAGSWRVKEESIMDVSKVMPTIIDDGILVGFKVIGAIVFYLVGRWLISFAIRRLPRAGAAFCAAQSSVTSALRPV
jgi:hypothetical protein